MKALFIFSLFALLLSCGICKKTKNQSDVIEEVPKEEATQNDTNYRYLGTVHISDACVYVETIMAPNETKKLYAVNLEEIHKIEGARIKFKYALSRAQMPTECVADIVVIVSDVTRVR